MSKRANDLGVSQSVNDLGVSQTLKEGGERKVGERGEMKKGAGEIYRGRGRDL